MHDTMGSRTWFRTYDDLRAFDFLRAPVWVFDVERHAMWWGNASALTFWQVESLDQLVARDFSSDSAIVRQRLRQIIDNPLGPKSVQETWTLFPLGRPTTVVIDFKPVLIDDGRQAVLIEASYPIELDRDPEALRILEAARNTPLLVSTFSLDGRLLAQNPAATSCYRRAIHPADRGGETLAGRLADPEIAERIRQAVVEDRSLQQDVEVCTAAGARFHRMAARRGRDPISGETAIVLTEEDITERVGLERELARANRELENRVAARTEELSNVTSRMIEEADLRALSEAALRDQSAFLQTLIDTIPAPVFYKDAEGRYRGCNRAFQALIGRGPENIVGKSTSQVTLPDTLERHLQADRDLLASSGGMQTYETAMRDARGERREVVIHKGLTRHGDGSVSGIAGVIVDVSELKRAEAQLRESQRLESIGRLTGGVAHDFNNLLTVVLGNLELLAEMLADDPKALSLITPALKSVNRGATLTDQLLAYARRQPLSPEPVAVNDVLSEIAELMGRTLGAPIEIVTRLGTNLPLALADAAQLQNAILNLCLNARDALMPGGGQLVIASGCARIEEGHGRSAGLDDLAPGEYLSLSVEDNGCGMSGDILERATEPFFSTKEVGQGSGLGLSMVYGFGRQTGGGLSMESQLGRGTRATLFLPAAEAERSAGMEESGEAPGQSGTRRGRRILVVEDDPEVLRYVTRSLESLGHEVVTAATGKEALARLGDDGAFDLLLTDVVLPGELSGKILADRALRIDPALKILFTSGYSRDEIVHDGRLDPGLEFLPKPFLRKNLADALYRLFD